MSKAAKRERQRQNREAARAVHQAAERRQRLKRSLRSFGILTAVIVVGYGLYFAFSGSSSKASATTCDFAKPKTHAPKTYPVAPPMTLDPTKTYTATMDTSCGKIVVALDSKNAPKTVNSFVYLARQGFYDGLTFHRIVKDFVDQGGDPKGDGSGGPGYTLPDEPPRSPYTAGSVAMANSGPNTSGSQFFIAVSKTGAEALGTTPPYKYSALGQITKGLDVAKKINTYGSSSSDQNGTPSKKIYTRTVTITETPAAASTTSTT